MPPKNYRPNKNAHIPSDHELVAMDCEYVGAADDKDMAARVSIVDGQENVLYDEHIKPTEPVVDYRTEISGVTEEQLTNGKEISEVRQKVTELIRGKYLIGHGVENDLKVIGITDIPRALIRDTAIYRFLRTGLSRSHWTPKLCQLAKLHLDKTIHGGAHNSVEDARVTMQIYKKSKQTWERNKEKYLENFDEANFSSGYRGDYEDNYCGDDSDYSYGS